MADLDGIQFEPEQVRQRLNGLFEDAKAQDEFEFCSTLLRIRGLEDVGWDPFLETSQLTSDLTRLIGSPLVGHTRARLGLLLYSHLTEVGAIYDILANLTRVTKGERYVVDPFLEDRPTRSFLSTPRKVNLLRVYLEDVGHGQIAELFDWFFVSGIRNSFSHADYVLHQDKFRSRSDLFSVSGIQTAELEMSLLFDVIDRALLVYQSMVEEHSTQRFAYQDSKVVMGRIAGDEPVPVELIGHEGRGLTGFRSPPQTAES